MVSDLVLDVYPHDQGQHLDEGSRTGAVEIPRPAQGAPIVGYRYKGGCPVIPMEYVDDHPKDRSGIEQS